MSAASANSVREVDAWRLRNDLLGNGYDSATRPALHENDTTQVHLTMDVIEGPLLNPDKEVFYAGIRLCMTWQDFRLKWNKTQYGGIFYTHFKAEDIWKPLLHTLISWTDVSSIVLSNSKFLVEDSGAVNMCSATTVHLFCNADMTHFPMDRHECTIGYSTIVDVAEDVNLTIKRTSVRGKCDSEFEPVFFNATSFNTDYGKFGSYSSVLFRFVMARRNRFQLFALLLPSVAVVQLGLLSLWLPPVSDRRFALSGAAFLASLLLLYRVDGAAPGSTRVPKITIVLLNALTIVLTIVNMNLVRCLSRRNLPAVVVKACGLLATGVPLVCPHPKETGSAAQDNAFALTRALDRLLFGVSLVTFVGIIV
ncbi:acetylcholine receptor subunit beta-like [Haemaphysalis longicornis]